MPLSHYVNEWTLLLAVQVAMTLWMFLDARQRPVEGHWYWLILLFQPLGPWAYFLTHKIKDYPRASTWLTNFIQRRPSMEELRHRTEQSPTPTNWMEMAERLIEIEEYAEAVPLLQSVLEREPDHCRSLFLLARAHRSLGNPKEGVPPLEKLVARNPVWLDYKGWHLLILVLHESGDQAGAVERARELARIAPSLENKCLLATHLLEAGQQAEARKIVEQALEDYRYLTGLSRRRDARWVGKARQLLRQIG